MILREKSWNCKQRPKGSLVRVSCIPDNRALVSARQPFVMNRVVGAGVTHAAGLTLHLISFNGEAYFLDRHSLAKDAFDSDRGEIQSCPSR